MLSGTYHAQNYASIIGGSLMLVQKLCQLINHLQNLQYLLDNVPCMYNIYI